MLGLPASQCYAYASTREADRSKLDRHRSNSAGVHVDVTQLVVAASVQFLGPRPPLPSPYSLKVAAQLMWLVREVRKAYKESQFHPQW